MLHLILHSALSSHLFQICTLVMLLVPLLLITVTSVEIDSMKKGLPERQHLCPIQGTRDQGCSGTGGGWLPTHPTAGGHQTCGGLFSTVHFCSFGHQNLWRRLIAPLQSWAHVQVASCNLLFFTSNKGSLTQSSSDCNNQTSSHYYQGNIDFGTKWKWARVVE